MREVFTQAGECPVCGRKDVKVYRIRGDRGEEAYECEMCASSAQDPGVPEGQERLARAIEELSRELRITRGLFEQIVTDSARAETRGEEPPDGIG